MVYKPKGRRFYLVEFRCRGKRILKRTKVTHAEDARSIEAAIRTELERGNYGILRPKPSLTLAEFLKDEFLPFIETRFREAKPNTAAYYQRGAKILLASPLAGLKLDAITDREAGQFIAANPDWKAAYVNKALRTLVAVSSRCRRSRCRKYLAAQSVLRSRCGREPDAQRCFRFGVAALRPRFPLACLRLHSSSCLCHERSLLAFWLTLAHSSEQNRSFLPTTKNGWRGQSSFRHFLSFERCCRTHRRTW